MALKFHKLREFRKTIFSKLSKQPIRVGAQQMARRASSLNTVSTWGEVHYYVKKLYI